MNTRLAVSGAKWFALYPKEQQEAISFFLMFTKLQTKVAIAHAMAEQWS